MEWAQLLEAQQRYHDAELQKWREIIKSSVLLLDQVKKSDVQRTFACSIQHTVELEALVHLLD